MEYFLNNERYKIYNIINIIVKYETMTLYLWVFITNSFQYYKIIIFFVFDARCNFYWDAVV